MQMRTNNEGSPLLHDCMYYAMHVIQITPTSAITGCLHVHA